MDVSTPEAKEIALQRVAAGASLAEAMASVGRTVGTWRDWRRKDDAFRRRGDQIRADLKAGVKTIAAVPDFPEFVERYLHMTMPHHHVRAWDVIRGKRPRDLHPSMTYQPGAYPGQYMVLNFPPDHAKSTIWAKAYAMYRICQDPNVRIGIVSQAQRFAKKQLNVLKFWMTNPTLFPELHAAFAPEGGWRSDDKADGLLWREDMIYVRGRSTAEQEPTVECLGIGGQIYGTRFDVLILDDVEDMGSASQYEAHANWIGQEVLNRLHPEHGQLIVLGTRMAPMDLYRHLRDEAKDEDGNPFYTYFAQPAVLEGEGGHSRDWVVLWPERLDPRKIAKNKAGMTDQRRFGFVYQQRDVTDEATFPAEAVDAAVNQRRFHGPMTPGAPGHRREGMQGLYVIGAWDPASSAGRNAMIVGGIDRQAKKRWVMEVWTKKGAGAPETLQRMRDLTVKYGIKEWRVEKNGVQEFLTNLPEITTFLLGQGCRLRPHETRQNKWDPQLGVEAALVPLFLSCVEMIDGRMVPLPDGHGRIELPATRHGMTTELLNQLKQWEPGAKRLIQDLVMALWFFELACRDYLRAGRGGQTQANSGFTLSGFIRKPESPLDRMFRPTVPMMAS